MVRILLVGLMVLGSAVLAAPGRAPVDCTFSNPRYSGNCVERVTPGEKQTPVQACRVVLGCLNDPRCVKTYCNATTIRGGWILESPKPDER
ncbi:MAG TPA: hypothetical protein VD833_06955 [Vicinamibacterales bacterium]|nr:hypothetical protein [Vicinamibacterales bacterium]